MGSKFQTQASFTADCGVRIFTHNEVTPTKDKFYISYNPGFMCEQTTALVIHDAKSMIFLSLKGNHKSGYDKVLESGGLEDVVDYYMNHMDEADSYSEHKLFFREGKLQGIPSIEELRELVGEAVFNKLRSKKPEKITVNQEIN